jgi:site-specific recombinase XerD
MRKLSHKYLQLVIFGRRDERGLEWVGFYDLRHFRVSQWVMRGGDLRTVQELMGHADIHLLALI